MMKVALILLFFAFSMQLTAQCDIIVPNDTVTLYNGYTPLSCATITVTPLGNAPFQYAWSNGDTTQSIVVCDTVSSWYFISMTDSLTCIDVDSIFVNVVDVRCGNNPNNQKVLVCHVPPGNPSNEHTICISENAVAAHLSHGCYLGTCASDTAQIAPSPNNLMVAVAPNPVLSSGWVSISSEVEQVVNIRLVDPAGRTVQGLPSSLLVGPNSPATQLQLNRPVDQPQLLWLLVNGADGEIVSTSIVFGQE